MSGRPFAGYPRVSRVNGRDEEDRFRSPELQCEAIGAKARGAGLALRMFPAELDVSGSKRERVILDEIISGVEAGELAGIIVAKLDRLSRLAPRERVELVDRIEAAGGVILSASEDCDPATPEGRFTRDLFFGIARMQWERYRDGFELAKRAAVADGKYIAKTAPMGYSFNAAHRLTQNGDARAVREAFRLAGTGASLRAIRDGLEERTGRRLAIQSLPGLLANRAYLGYSVHGVHENREAHKAIVSQSQFDSAQRKPTGLKKSGTRSLLAGIARCGSCGRKMGSTNVGGVSAGTRVYRCPKTSGTGEPCSAPVAIKETALDEYVIGEVRQWAESAGLEERVIASRRKGDPIEAARAVRLEAEAKRDAYAVETAAMDIPAKTVALGLAARQEAVQRAVAAEEAAQAADTTAVARTTVRELWPSLTTAERRQLIASVVGSVVIRRAASRGRVEPVAARAAIRWL